jgi:YD repeat-containing protein
LNLPAVITVTAKGTITYTYDAAGNKLRKVTNETSTSVVEGSTTHTNINVINTTDYISGLVFESKTYNSTAAALSYANKLQFAGHEEGRIRATYYHPTQPHTLTGFAYDYMIKDHLGNVRMLLTDEGKTDTYPAATMEATTIADEEKLYANLTSTQDDKPTGGWFIDPLYPTNLKVAKLKNASGLQKLGPNILLKVMAGDSYNIRVASGWNSGSSPSNSSTNVLADMLGAVTTGVAGARGGKATALDLQNPSLGLNTALSNFIGTQSSTAGKPRAFISWVLLYEQFKIAKDASGNIIGSGYSGSEMVGSSGITTIHTLANLTAAKSGYFFQCSQHRIVEHLKRI